MAKVPITGWMHEPIGAVLGSRSKVAVLRILWRATSAISYREVVRRSGMAYGSINLALADLTSAGLVEELDGGRERRVKLRSSHRLANAIGNLLQTEADFFSSLRIELRSVAQLCQPDGLVTAAIVGAAAQREEALGRPIELVMIAETAPAVARCVARFDAAAEMIAARFGVRVKLITYDLVTARAMWRTRTVAAERGVKVAEHLAGAPLEDVLSVQR